VKRYISVICFSLFFICCSKTGNKTNNSTDSNGLGKITVAPENLRIKILGHNAIFLQPEDHFQYDGIGRVTSARDSLTAQQVSGNVYPSIPTYSGNNTIPDIINYYWICWNCGLHVGPDPPIDSRRYSSNSFGQIIAISSDSSYLNATFLYGNRYIVTRYFDKIQSKTIYYDSALFSASDDISTEYQMFLEDTVAGPKYDTLSYTYTNYPNPEFYVSLIEYPAHFYAAVPLLTVSRHMPSSVVSPWASSPTSYSYQTDNQGRPLAQIDGKGNIIRTYSYY
jgi:hypothetical protein